MSDLDVEDPGTQESKLARKPKTISKKEADLTNLLVNIIYYFMTNEQLAAELCKNSWKQFPQAISLYYCFIPAKVKMNKYHFEDPSSTYMDTGESGHQHLQLQS